MTRILVGIVIAAMAVTLAYVFEVPKALGAHPFWDQQVLFIGAGIGAILGLISLRLPNVARIGGFLALTVLAYLAASWGKETFAASYAEDAVAGRVWYFGWFATVAAATAFLFSLATPKKALPR